MTETSIVQSARSILGNSEENSLEEIFVPIEAVRPALVAVIRKLNRLYGNSGARVESIFVTEPDVQDYNIADEVGDDVLKVVSVTREGANVYSGFTSCGGHGQQEAVLDEIVATQRQRRHQEFSWEIANVDGARHLRLMPTPRAHEYVEVIYVATGASIATLPDEAESALIYGACVALTDAMVNRLSSQKVLVTGQFGPADGPNSIARLKALTEQRQRYLSLYNEALTDLRHG